MINATGTTALLSRLWTSSLIISLSFVFITCQTHKVLSVTRIGTHCELNNLSDRMCYLQPYRTQCLKSPEKYRSSYTVYIFDSINVYSGLSESCRKLLLPKENFIGQPVQLFFDRFSCELVYEECVDEVSSYYNTLNAPCFLILMSGQDGPKIKIKNDTICDLLYSDANWKDL